MQMIDSLLERSSKMCHVCEAAAAQVATENAQATSARLTNHGRAPHGRDAGAQEGDARTQRNIEQTWQRIYTATLATERRKPHPR
jgi:hypothetical protein